MSRARLHVALVLGVLCSSTAVLAKDEGCERIAVVPLEPVAVTPQVARVEEDRVRAALATLSGVCVVERKASAELLRRFEGHRLPACEDATCRRKLAGEFGADWLYSGAVYGLGGGRTVTLTLWNADGGIVQRGSYASTAQADANAEAPTDEKAAAETTLRLLREARLGRSFATTDGTPGEDDGHATVTRSRWPQIVLGAGAVAALAGGLAFASASNDTARGVEGLSTGCPGTGSAYAQCFSDELQSGRDQATAANVLFGASALLGAGAAVLFVVDLP